ncbi:MAG: SDR family oxidoreductase, partial [Deltaproteobacteria bacterium]
EGVIRESMDLMYYGPLHSSRAAIPHLRTRGGGRIINISSIFGKQPGGLVDYDSVKAALNMLTKDMANYLAGDKILVNAVCPGPIKGPLWEEPGGLGDQLGGFLGMPGPDAIEAFAKQNIPLGHYGDPEDVSALVAYLASPHGKFITGQAINVDGGMVKTLI